MLRAGKNLQLAVTTAIPRLAVLCDVGAFVSISISLVPKRLRALRVRLSASILPSSTISHFHTPLQTADVLDRRCVLSDTILGIVVGTGELWLQFWGTGAAHDMVGLRGSLGKRGWQ